MGFTSLVREGVRDVALENNGGIAVMPPSCENTSSSTCKIAWMSECMEQKHSHTSTALTSPESGLVKVVSIHRRKKETMALQLSIRRAGTVWATHSAPVLTPNSMKEGRKTANTRYPVRRTSRTCTTTPLCNRPPTCSVQQPEKFVVYLLARILFVTKNYTMIITAKRKHFYTTRD